MKNKKYTSQGFPIIWEEVEAEDLTQDGELSLEEIDADVKYKIKLGYYRYVYHEGKGKKTLHRRNDIGLMELERWADND